jgi:hypothetical protein
MMNQGKQYTTDMRRQSLLDQQSHLGAVKDLFGIIGGMDRSQAQYLGQQTKMAHEQNLQQHRMMQGRQKLAAMMEKRQIDIARVNNEIVKAAQTGDLQRAQALKALKETELMPAYNTARNAHLAAQTELLGTQNRLAPGLAEALMGSREAGAYKDWVTADPLAEYFQAGAGTREEAGKGMMAKNLFAGQPSVKELTAAALGVFGPELQAAAQEQLRTRLAPPSQPGFAALPVPAQSPTPAPQRMAQPPAAVPVTPAARTAPTAPAGGAQAAAVAPPRKAAGAKKQADQFPKIRASIMGRGFSNPEVLMQRYINGSSEDREQIIAEVMKRKKVSR